MTTLRNFLVEAISIALAGVLILNGWQKLPHFEVFAEEVFAYRIFSPYYAALFAASLPWCEIASGFLLLFNKYRKTGAMTAGIIFLLFLVAQISVLARKMNVDCGCGSVLFSSTATKVGTFTVIRATTLLGLAALILFIGGRSYRSGEEPNALLKQRCEDVNA